MRGLPPGRGDRVQLRSRADLLLNAFDALEAPRRRPRGYG